MFQSVVILIILVFGLARADIMEMEADIVAKENNITFMDGTSRDLWASFDSTFLRYVGGTDVLGITRPWIVALVEQMPQTGALKHNCPGAIYNQKWAIINSVGGETITEKLNVYVVSKSDVMGDILSQGLLIRRIRDIDFVTRIGDLLDPLAQKLSVVKLCPPIMDPSYYAPTVPSTFTYAIGDNIEFYTYGPNFHRFIKKIGPLSGCSPYLSNFDQTRILCSEVDANNKMVTSDLRGAIGMINSRFAAITIDRGNGAELFIDISKHIASINAKTPI